ncbi:MAG: magnesium transporter CorA family protein [Firmicutes bacterium]|nr:magnesium transporter CorA family protein [Bacillota bacterium]
MLKFYKTEGSAITEIEALEVGCWVSAVAPTESEISMLETELGVDRDFIRSALDEEESSRIESEEKQTLIVLDYPVAEKPEQPETGRRKKHGIDDDTITYYTMPMSIILTENNVITVSLKENSIVEDFADNVVKNVKTQFKTRFIFAILLRIAGKYLQYLKQIDKISNYVEVQLHKSMKNKELIQLLGLEKSLVYFSTSLKSTETVLEKILRGRVIKLYDEDQDLLEDVLIEVKQAIEMSNIYSNILSGTMDAFASVISNNLNIVMKVLTIITIVMAVPTMVFSFYGMNVAGLPFADNIYIPVAISAVLALIAGIVLSKSKFYK